MFDRLTAGLTRALNALSGRGYLSEDNIADTVARCASRCSTPTWRCPW